MIVGFTGRKRTGKNTAAAVIERQRSFAARLKEMCVGIWDLDWDQVDGEHKESPVGPIEIDRAIGGLEAWTGLHLPHRGLVAYTPRQLLQYVGTDYIRSVDPDYWINYLIGDIPRQPLVAVTDVRFANEAAAIHRAGGVVVRITRPGLVSDDNHPSEAEIDRLEVDAEFVNAGTPSDLQVEVSKWLSRISS